MLKRYLVRITQYCGFQNYVLCVSFSLYDDLLSFWVRNQNSDTRFQSLETLHCAVCPCCTPPPHTHTQKKTPTPFQSHIKGQTFRDKVKWLHFENVDGEQVVPPPTSKIAFDALSLVINWIKKMLVLPTSASQVSKLSCIMHDWVNKCPVTKRQCHTCVADSLLSGAAATMCGSVAPPAAHHNNDYVIFALWPPKCNLHYVFSCKKMGCTLNCEAKLKEMQTLILLYTMLEGDHWGDQQKHRDKGYV